jgi:hypothetical protein
VEHFGLELDFGGTVGVFFGYLDTETEATAVPEEGRRVRGGGKATLGSDETRSRVGALHHPGIITSST